MSKIDGTLFLLIIALMIFLGFLYVKDFKYEEIKAKKCQDAGGVYYRPYKSRSVCLKGAINLEDI